MDLDDLLEREGIDASEVDDTLVWARARAEELLVGLDSDPELAALLEGGATPTATGEAEAEDPPELDPLAGIDFDDLPGVDEDEEPLVPSVVEPPLGNRDHGVEEGVEEGVEMTIPSMQAPISVDETPSMSTEGFSSVDQTQRAANPLEGAPEGVPREVSPTTTERTDGGEAADADEEEIEEFEDFEILDDDDLELVEEDEDEVEAASVGSSTTPAGEVPEWQAALTSAQLGGGREADEDSGLLPRPASLEPSESAEASESAGSSAAEAEGEAEDESDVDLGDD